MAAVRMAWLVCLITGCASPAHWADGECVAEEAEVRCEANVAPVTALGVQREVYWRAPDGVAPEGGWPVLVVYQGSFFPPSTTWGTVPKSLPYGGYQQARLQVLARDSGFLVVAPTAVADVAWQTNAPVPWATTNDSYFITALLDRLQSGAFGPVNMSRLYATGISSGGYMTSRMALSYAGKFRGLIINSGSWATCIGAACVLPDALPVDHPPTLFLQGGADAIVPLSSVQPYVDALTAQGTEVQLVVDELAGHEWLHDSPERITAFITSH